jgi:hypothetical protein
MNYMMSGVDNDEAEVDEQDLVEANADLNEDDDDEGESSEEREEESLDDLDDLGATTPPVVSK